MKRDITDLSDVQLLVDTFYSKVRHDELIGPVFQKVVKENWQPHLEKMYRFWQSILLNEPTYSGRPFPPHIKLRIGTEHFERWVSLFEETAFELFEGERTLEAVKRAKLMGALFHSKLEHFNNQS